MEALTSYETVEILNDLVRISNDRIAGYMKALEDLQPEDQDLKVLFTSNIDQSRRFKLVLGTELQAIGGDMQKEAALSGAIYRAWTGVQTTLIDHSRHSILVNCAYGEDAAQKAYETALNSEYLPAHMATTITEEKELLSIAHDQVKTLLALCN